MTSCSYPLSKYFRPFSSVPTVYQIISFDHPLSYNVKLLIVFRELFIDSVFYCWHTFSASGKMSSQKPYVRDKKINILKLLCSFSAGHVSIQLRNRGSDAFQHSKYGDSLTIERRISADGGSSYRVKSSEGKFNFVKMLWLFIVVHCAGRTI